MITVTYLGGSSFETLAVGTDFSAPLPGGLAGPSPTQVDVLVVFTYGRLSEWSVTGGTSAFSGITGTVATMPYDGAMTTCDVHQESVNSSEFPTPGYVEGVSVRILAYRLTMAPSSDASTTRSFTWAATASRTADSSSTSPGDTVVTVDSTLIQPAIPSDTAEGAVSTHHYGFAIVMFGAHPDQRGVAGGGGVHAYRDGVPLTAPTWTDPVPIDTGLALTPLGLTDVQWGMPLYDSRGGGISQSPMRVHHTSDVTFPTAQGYNPATTVCATQYGATVLTAFLAIVETVEVLPVPICPDNLQAVAISGGVRLSVGSPIVIRVLAGPTVMAVALPEDGCPPLLAANAQPGSLRLRPHTQKD